MEEGVFIRLGGSMAAKATTSIASILARQFEASWKMIHQALECVPDEFWHKGISDWYFSLTAFHIAETAKFYSGNNPDAMKWGSHAGIDWKQVKNKEKEALPKLSKDFVSSYLQEMESHIASTLSSISTTDFSNKDGFHWFSSILEKWVYLLRHNMFHAGELFRALREWGCKRPEWK
jgi:hypothetical protein